MKVIYKYRLQILREQCMPVPMESKFLSLVEQDGWPVVYFLVNSEEKSQNPVRFLIVGTGQEQDAAYLDGCRFIGTVCIAYYTWHIWMDASRILEGA